jgi:hypothetical protein
VLKTVILGNEELPESLKHVTLNGLPPESPYSDRAEMAAERYAQELLDGKHPKVFDPNRDYVAESKARIAAQKS